MYLISLDAHAGSGISVWTKIPTLHLHPPLTCSWAPHFTSFFRFLPNPLLLLEPHACTAAVMLRAPHQPWSPPGLTLRGHRCCRPSILDWMMSRAWRQAKPAPSPTPSTYCARPPPNPASRSQSPPKQEQHGREQRRHHDNRQNHPWPQTVRTQKSPASPRSPLALLHPPSRIALSARLDLLFLPLQISFELLALLFK